MIEHVDHSPQEWSYYEHPSGVVFGLGRDAGNGNFEATATYVRVDEAVDTPKVSLETGYNYRRLMFNGLPEELPVLETASSQQREVILDRYGEAGTCAVVDTGALVPRSIGYQRPEDWLNYEDKRMAKFADALSTALSVMDSHNVSTQMIRLYGGAALGLVDVSSKLTEDVDLVVGSAIGSGTIRDLVTEHASDFTWQDIDPTNTLSFRKALLKAKRWTGSQIRLSGQDNLTIDFKIARDPNAPTAWDQLDGVAEETTPFQGYLRVVEDQEAYCFSPAVVCERQGSDEPITLLMQGYPYAGCALKDDVIFVRGREYQDASMIFVNMSHNDIVVPDLTGATVYDQALKNKLEQVL